MNNTPSNSFFPSKLIVAEFTVHFSFVPTVVSVFSVPNRVWWLSAVCGVSGQRAAVAGPRPGCDDSWANVG